ncbi:hypothetical protein N7494_011063 [Penicillium frequentans]|uniref:Uncharacterized protein n=1 Tax=Penicillium frequentans TaxID=3151616 RepID=A0AAD6CIZ3_9EURO|nr:hypothetical protein N7494_011063 [Penicillium glabrum]
MSERINGIVSPIVPTHALCVAFSIEDVKENKDEILKVGAKVSFVYEPGTSEQSADDVNLR